MAFRRRTGAVSEALSTLPSRRASRPRFWSTPRPGIFHIDAARVRHAPDKGRVERAVPGVRDDCFAGEVLTTLDDAETAFAGPRFRALYQRWLIDDERVLDAAMSGVLVDRLLDKR